MQVQAAGLPWFAEDDYSAFQRVLPDRSWHPTFAEWLRAAEEAFQRCEAAGMFTVKAHVRSHEFVEWCRATDRQLVSKSLTAWGNEVAIREYAKSQGH